MEETKTRLVRESTFSRVLSVYVGTTSYTLADIIIYNNKGIICRVGRGYFDNDVEIDIKGEVVLRRKENLDRKENFILRNKEDSWSIESTYDLYVYVDNADVKYEGAKKEYEFVYQVYNVGGGIVKKLIKRLADNKWKIKDELQKELNKLETYKLPIPEEEIKVICANIKKYNKQLLDIEQYVEDYEPTDEDNIERIG